MEHFDPKATLDSIGLGKKQQKRSIRVADAIRNEVSILLLQKIRDRKISAASISRVEVSDDLKYAKIYYTVFGGKKEISDAEQGFRRAQGFIRSHIAKTLNMRYTPELQFRYDAVAEKVEEIERLFQTIAGERESDEKNS